MAKLSKAEKRILIIDDSQPVLVMLQGIIEREGLGRVFTAGNADEAFELLGINPPKDDVPEIDLVLMDIVMPGTDGIEACKVIKDDGRFKDVLIVMVTMQDDINALEKAFEAGAVDYIVKPVQRLELLARVRSALRLKQEIDRNKEWEKELLEVTCQLEKSNRQLQRLSIIDGLTGIGNRRYLDDLLATEWKRAIRNSNPISFLMIDIDCFKEYNDCCGHQQGDECLVKVGQALCAAMKRSGDVVARYGGEEFAVVLPNTDLDGALVIAKRIQENVHNLSLVYKDARITDRVTVSIGVASGDPVRGSTQDTMVNDADRALYKAKKDGRNRIVDARSL